MIYRILYATYYIYIILLCGDVELNPGPKPNANKCFFICHWNLNSITSHSLLKVSLLLAYNAVHNFHIICISESYLNSRIFSNDDKLSIPVYCTEQIIHRITDAEEFIIRGACLSGYITLDTFKNVFALI